MAECNRARRKNHKPPVGELRESGGGSGHLPPHFAGCEKTKGAPWPQPSAHTHTHTYSSLFVLKESALTHTHTRAPVQSALSAPRDLMKNRCEFATFAKLQRMQTQGGVWEFHGHIWRTIILRRNSERDQCSSRRRRQNTASGAHGAGADPAAAAATRTAEPKHHQHPLASYPPTYHATHPHTASQPAEVHLFKLLISKPSQPPTPAATHDVITFTFGSCHTRLIYRLYWAPWARVLSACDS